VNENDGERKPKDRGGGLVILAQKRQGYARPDRSAPNRKVQRTGTFSTWQNNQSEACKKQVDSKEITPQLRLEGNSPLELPGLAVVLSGKQLKNSFYVDFSTCKINWILPS
jgi:hypothetical protein